MWLHAPAAALALLAAPAAAQTGSALPEVAAWAGRFMRIVAGPGAVTTACAPQLNAAMAQAHDAASARRAWAAAKPCADRVRAAYAAIPPQLEALPPLPASAEASTALRSRQVLADQRRLAGQTVAYLDDLDRMMAAVAAGNSAGAARLYPRVRAEGAALLDGNILTLRVQQAAAEQRFVRQTLELRIVLIEAARAFATATPTAGTFTLGTALSPLAGRASAAAAAVQPGWQADQARLPASVRGTPHIVRIVAAGDRYAAEVRGQGERLAALLTVAGRTPTVSAPAATRFATDLNAIEAALLAAGQRFAAAVQES